MKQRGIRGAITVDENTIEKINDAVIELITEIKKQNVFDDDDISHVIFTMTDDLNCVYPAKIAREHFNWKYVPLMCTQELKIKNSLTKCIRILLVLNTDKNQDDIKHIYLRDAKKLRGDLVK